MAPVTLHVYDVSTQPTIAEINKILTAIGTGAFHGAVEIFGKEWSYGAAESGTGVFCGPPKQCSAHHFRESIPLGDTKLSPPEVSDKLKNLMEEWQGKDYDLLNKNCVTFCDTFCKQLGVEPIPKWVTNLAGAGASIQDGAKAAASSAQAAAIIAAAKADEIDKKYKVKDKASEAWSKTMTQSQVAYAHATEKYKELDAQYKIADNATDAQTKTRAQAALLAMHASNKASELDKQYKLQETALSSANKAWGKIMEVDQKYGVKAKAGEWLTKGIAGAKVAAAGAAAKAQGKNAEPAIEGRGEQKKEGCDACAVM